MLETCTVRFIPFSHSVRTRCLECFCPQPSSPALFTSILSGTPVHFYHCIGSMVKALANERDCKGYAYICFSQVLKRLIHNTEANPTWLLYWILWHILAFSTAVNNRPTLCKSSSFGSVLMQPEAGSPGVLLEGSVKLSAMFWRLIGLRLFGWISKSISDFKVCFYKKINSSIIFLILISFYQVRSIHHKLVLFSLICIRKPTQHKLALLQMSLFVSGKTVIRIFKGHENFQKHQKGPL